MPAARTVELGAGRTLHAVQARTGPDLVLLHGALATHCDWLAGPFDALACRYRVTAVDRPGPGKSRRPRFSGTRDQAAQMPTASTRSEWGGRSSPPFDRRPRRARAGRAVRGARRGAGPAGADRLSGAAAGRVRPSRTAGEAGSRAALLRGRRSDDRPALAQGGAAPDVGAAAGPVRLGAALSL